MLMKVKKVSGFGFQVSELSAIVPASLYDAVKQYFTGRPSSIILRHNCCHMHFKQDFPDT
jgi:hypothetical protein